MIFVDVFLNIKQWQGLSFFHRKLKYELIIPGIPFLLYFTTIGKFCMHKLFPPLPKDKIQVTLSNLFSYFSEKITGKLKQEHLKR